MSTHERHRLAAWIDGELPPEERTAVEAHLAECEECRALVADLEAVDGLARELPLEAPAGYFETFPARVRSRIEAAGPRRGTRRPAWRTPAWTWAAAAALLLGVVTPLTLARLDRDSVPGEELTLATPPAARAPRASADEERPAALEGPPEPVGRASTVEAKTPVLEELKKERDRDPTDADDTSGGGRQGASAEGFASAPAAERRAMSPSPARSDAPSAPAVRDVLQSQALVLEKDTRPDERAFKGEVTVDDPWPRSEIPRSQSAAAVGEAEAPAERPGRAGATTAPLAAAPQGKSRPRLEAADTGGAREDSHAFSRLNRHDPVGAAAWRQHREAWLLFLEEHPRSPLQDEARVRAIEAGIEAWRADGDPEDLAQARADAEAYLARKDAGQGDRVRRAFEAIGER